MSGDLSGDAAAIWLAYNRAENDGDFTAMMRLIAGDLAVTVNGRPAVASADDDERAMRELKSLYPDYRRKVDEVIPAGERATVRWRMLGTAIRPDVAELQVAGCSVVRAVGGVLTEAHLYYQGAALDDALASASAPESVATQEETP